jgi:hypothetical protein
VSTARKPPSSVLEVLRMLVVVFFAGAGYQIGSSLDGDRQVLGSLNGTAVGLILGSGFGYVLGGVIGRTTASTAAVAPHRLRDVSADTLVAGALGTIGGVLLGAGVAWPVFFLPQAYLAFPLFGFVVVVLGYLGFQVGASKRDGVLAMFGDRAGIAPRPLPAAARDRVVDSSVAIDGRVLDVVRAGFLHGRFRSRPPCSPSSRASPTPVTTPGARAAAAASRSSTRSSGSRGSTSRCSTSTSPPSTRSTASSCGSASTPAPPC